MPTFCRALAALVSLINGRIAKAGTCCLPCAELKWGVRELHSFACITGPVPRTASTEQMPKPKAPVSYLTDRPFFSALSDKVQGAPVTIKHMAISSTMELVKHSGAVLQSALATEWLNVCSIWSQADRLPSEGKQSSVEFTVAQPLHLASVTNPDIA